MNMNLPQSPAKALIFADGLRQAQSCAALEAVGSEIAEVLPLESLFERLDRQAGARTICVDFSNAADRIEASIPCIERFTAATGSAAIASAPIALIDRLDAAAADTQIRILCDPDLADRIAALATIADPAPMRLSDSAAQIDSLRLKRLADEVNRIARALTSLSVDGDQHSPRARNRDAVDPRGVHDVQMGFAAEPAQTVMPPASEIRAMLRLRRLRENFFDSDLFADPAWDILLDLLAARLEEDQVAVSSLCIAAAVPPTTALRWIKTMTDAQLLERHADPMDGRRIFIRLTEDAATALGRFFAAARRQGGMLI